MNNKILDSSSLSKVSGGNQYLGNCESGAAVIIASCEHYQRCPCCGANLEFISTTDEGNGISIEYKCNNCGCGGGGFIYKD